MLGLGTNIIKSGAGVKTIVTDNLVLRHGYAVNPVQPLSDGAAFFDPTDDYIDFGNACNLGAADFSIAFWVYTDNLSTNYFLSKREDDNDRWYIRSDADDKFHMFCKTGGSVIFSVTSSTAWTSLENTWIHVAFTADRGGNHKIYVNGALDVTDSESSTTDVDNTGDLYMNRFSGSYGTAGSGTGNYICNTGIWSGVLSQAQIKSIMNKNYAGLTSSEKEDLVSWWNLDSTINEDYASTSETDADPSTITGLTLDNHDTTFTETSITNSDFTSGSGTTITGWTNDGNQWTRVDDTVVSGTSAQLLRMPSALENNTAHKIIIRAKRTTLDSAAILSVYIGGNNYAKHSLTNDFVEYITHGLQANDTTLFLYNSSDTNVTIDWVKVYKYDGNVGNLL